MRLIIVESPKKARTLASFAPAGYRVVATMGHVRDLPAKGIGLEIGERIVPQYEVIARARRTVSEIRSAARGAEAILLATDPDREGEAIAWHLAEAADLPMSRTSRIAFHEISDRALRTALARPRKVDANLVDAQQARRILDRLVGYGLSPLLWRAVQRGTSGGRVQSVALRIVVDREREIRAFVPEEYWTIDVTLSTVASEDDDVEEQFVARLMQVGEHASTFPNSLGYPRTRAPGRLIFHGPHAPGRLISHGPHAPGRLIESEATAQSVVAALHEALYRVIDVVSEVSERPPPPPFTTSTLQQAAASRFRLRAQRTMQIAQSLYESGLITYMRTDSVVVAPEAVQAVRAVIASDFGEAALPSSARHFRSRAKNAQEAHEAIRPVDPARRPSVVAAMVPRDEGRLYGLIWSRMVASQMVPSRVRTDRAMIEAEAPADLDQPARHVGQGSAPLSRQSATHKPAPPPALPSSSGGEAGGGGISLPSPSATYKPVSPAHEAKRQEAGGAYAEDEGISTFVGEAVARASEGGHSAHTHPAATRFVLEARAASVVSPGWLAVYGVEAGSPSAQGDDLERDADVDLPPANASLPDLSAHDVLALQTIVPTQEFTAPPSRFSEASLVRALEAAGIGRPSTYATILSTIEERGYVGQSSRAFVPTTLGFAVNDYLARRFPEVVDVQFTARMEQRLDDVAAGQLDWQTMLGDFYSGFSPAITRADAAVTADRLDVARSVADKPASPAHEAKGATHAPGDLGDVMKAAPGRGRRTRAPATTNSVLGNDESSTEVAGPVGVAPVRRRSGLTDAPMARRTRADARSGFQDAEAGAAFGVESVSDVGRPVKPEACPKCGKPMVARQSTFGEFWGCSGYPRCRTIQRAEVGGSATASPLYPPATKSRRMAKGESPASSAYAPAAPLPRRRDRGVAPTDRDLAVIEPSMPAMTPGSLDMTAPHTRADADDAPLACPKCGKPMVARRSQYGEFWGCSSYPACREIYRPDGEAAPRATKARRAPARRGSAPPDPMTARVVRARGTYRRPTSFAPTTDERD